MKKEILELWKLIKKSENILLVSHIRMDPDTFWSIWAFYYILEKMWKNVKATNEEYPPEGFNFLSTNHIIEPELDIKEFNPDLIICLDAWSLDQLWTIYKNNESIFKNTNFVNIDHHLTNDGYWNLNIIEHDASSTCELLYEIFIELWYKKYLDKKIANLLISGILTDTNLFYNKNTTPKTLRTIADLIELDWDINDSIFNFFKKTTFKKMKLWWKVLSEINEENDWKIAWVKVKRKMFDKTETTDKDITWLIWEFLINIEWVEVCFILYELASWEVKASFRSKKHDVANFVKSFSWWWHKLAAWFISNENIEDVEEEILKKLKKEV